MCEQTTEKVEAGEAASQTGGNGDGGALVRAEPSLAEIFNGASFEPQDLGQAYYLSKALANSQLLPPGIQTSADIFMVLLMANDLGLSPMAALRGIQFIEGSATMRADLMEAIIINHEACDYFRLVESTPEQAVYETKRAGSEPVTWTYTIEDAKQAGLVGRKNWGRYPKNMLRARCKSELARLVYPDVLMGFYTADEISTGVTDGDSPPIKVQAESIDPPAPREDEEAALDDVEAILEEVVEWED
ncbi:MAG: hypothetical protein GF364_22885 [Candidatus Lokiarchaeota archaeon]|nr:hypothetical protein [Candidatus Lokiarchaeota archaeon]